MNEYPTIKIDELKPYERNARLHPSEQVEKIANSIREFGFITPVIIDENDMILVGHGRTLAAKECGMTEVPYRRITNLSEDQKRAYILADNKLSDIAEWDEELLRLELGEIDFDMERFGFENIEVNIDWFNREAKDGSDRQEGNDEYNEFLDKFEIKKTTDDCYTPKAVYDAVADWVANEYDLDKKNFVRPFYPNGDYEKENYKDTDVVVDNPPFSILSEILKFYNEKGIKFFLFAPTLTLFSSAQSAHSCALLVDGGITYENGANVATSFLTNLEMEYRIRTAPTLHKAVSKANKEVQKELHRELPKFEYCDYILTSSRLAQFSRYEIDFRVPRNECQPIKQLDAQKESGKAIFGGGYIVSEKIKAEKEKAEKEKAEKEKAEKEKAEKWELSEREMEIVKSLKVG